MYPAVIAKTLAAAGTNNIATSQTDLKAKVREKVYKKFPDLGRD